MLQHRKRPSEGVRRELTRTGSIIDRQMQGKAKRDASPEWVSQITALRDRLGINQAELARRLECSAMTISRWERGLLQPSAEHFIQLGNLGNRTEAWFFWEMAGIQPARMVEALGGTTRAKRPAAGRRKIEIGGHDGWALATEKKSDMVGVPLLKAVAGTHGTAGDKRNSLRTVPTLQVIAVPGAWCPNPTYTSLIRVTGRSMQPAIRDHDILAVDSYQAERGRLYGQIVLVTSEAHGLSVSRLSHYDRIDVLEAEDRHFEPVILKKSGGLRIVGLVLWSISGIT
jgi:transcriptional regulator with XRE-family HTH domain